MEFLMKKYFILAYPFNQIQYFMSHFVSRIESQHGYLNFYFNSQFKEESIHFHVSVIDRNSEAITFQMEELHQGVWIISNRIKAPYWILHLEQAFAREIVSRA